MMIILVGKLLWSLSPTTQLAPSSHPLSQSIERKTIYPLVTRHSHPPKTALKPSTGSKNHIPFTQLIGHHHFIWWRRGSVDQCCQQQVKMSLSNQAKMCACVRARSTIFRIIWLQRQRAHYRCMRRVQLKSNKLNWFLFFFSFLLLYRNKLLPRIKRSLLHSIYDDLKLTTFGFVFALLKLFRCQKFKQLFSS